MSLLHQHLSFILSQQSFLVAINLDGSIIRPSTPYPSSIQINHDPTAASLRRASHTLSTDSANTNTLADLRNTLILNPLLLFLAITVFLKTDFNICLPVPPFLPISNRLSLYTGNKCPIVNFSQKLYEAKISFCYPLINSCPF